jgi:hypothetical protein
MYLNITIDKIKNSSVKKDKKKRILELWTEETKDEEKDRLRFLRADPEKYKEIYRMHDEAKM